MIRDQTLSNAIILNKTSAFQHFAPLWIATMASSAIPADYVYCVQAGKKHHDIFTTAYAGEKFCGRCGLANPLLSQRRATSRTPALPGPDDEVVELEDTPPRPVSPASQLLRQKPVPFAGVGHAQLLPNSIISFSNGAKKRAQMTGPIYRRSRWSHQLQVKPYATPQSALESLQDTALGINGFT